MPRGYDVEMTENMGQTSKSEARHSDGDLHTVLRHLCEQIQWGGNRGQRDECFAALDRMTSAKGSQEHAEASEEVHGQMTLPETDTKSQGGTQPGKAKR